VHGSLASVTLPAHRRGNHTFSAHESRCDGHAVPVRGNCALLAQGVESYPYTKWESALLRAENATPTYAKCTRCLREGSAQFCVCREHSCPSGKTTTPACGERGITPCAENRGFPVWRSRAPLGLAAISPRGVIVFSWIGFNLFTVVYVVMMRPPYSCFASFFSDKS
jgi:hypothetical protein